MEPVRTFHLVFVKTFKFVCHELVKLFPSLLSCGDVLWYWYYG